jgi:hypothetical protein
MASATQRRGTVVRARDGKPWQPLITLADGSRRRLAAFPRGTSEAMAREKTAYYQEQADKRGITSPELAAAADGARAPTEQPARPSADLEARIDRWLTDRRAAGMTSVKENESHWRVHIAPELGTTHIRDWTRDDLRRLSLALEQKARDGKLSPKTAGTIWGTATRMRGDACQHDDGAIRVRAD